MQQSWPGRGFEDYNYNIHYNFILMVNNIKSQGLLLLLLLVFFLIFSIVSTPYKLQHHSFNIARLLWQVAATLKLSEVRSTADFQCWVNCLYVLYDNADKNREIVWMVFQSKVLVTNWFSIFKLLSHLLLCWSFQSWVGLWTFRLTFGGDKFWYFWYIYSDGFKQMRSDSYSSSIKC